MRNAEFLLKAEPIKPEGASDSDDLETQNKQLLLENRALKKILKQTLEELISLRIKLQK